MKEDEKARRERTMEKYIDKDIYRLEQCKRKRERRTRGENPKKEEEILE